MSASASAAYRDGWRRVLRAPALAAGVLLAVTLVSSPAAWLVRDGLLDALGDSELATRLTSGFDLPWWKELADDAEGLMADFGPSVIGFAAVLRNTSDLVSGMVGGEMGGSRASWLVVAIWFVAGTALSGGVLDRFARQRALHLDGFFAACGRTVFRLLRLNVLVLMIYLTLGSLAAGLGAPALEAITRDQTAERVVFFWYAAATAGVAILFGAVTIVADCARVRLVVEDRRSALFALVAGWRFARRRPGALLRLYVMLAGTVLGCAAVYALAAPGATASGAWVWLGLLVGQAYVAARVLVKLLTYAAATSFFQSELAHAQYIAAPAPVWPESPAVETLGPIGAEPPDARH